MSRSFFLPFGLKPKDKAKDSGPSYADIYERAFAAGIDLWILYIMLARFFVWLERALFPNANQEVLESAKNAESFRQIAEVFWYSGAAHLWMLNAVLQLIIIGFFIVGIQWAWEGTTPGKRLLGLKIVKRKTFEEPERWRFVVRYIGYMIAGLPLMIGFFWASFNKERRGWHDIIAGTVVIHTRPDGWYWGQVKRGFRWLRTKIFGSRPVE